MQEVNDLASFLHITKSTHRQLSVCSVDNDEKFSQRSDVVTGQYSVHSTLKLM